MSELSKIVLTRRIRKLGQTGDEVKVSPGYRRYLINSNIGVSLEQSSWLKLKKTTELKTTNPEEELNLFEKLNNKVVSFVRKASTQGMLHGSVTRKDIGEGIENQLLKASKTSDNKGTLDYRNIEMTERFKRLGVYNICVNISDKLHATLRIVIGNTPEECDSLLKRSKESEVSGEDK